MLFKNKTWQIEKIGNKEISISNGNNKCYAYLTKKSYFDKQIEHIVKFYKKTFTW